MHHFFRPYFIYLYHTLSCKKYKAILVITSKPPMAIPIFILPVMAQLKIIVSNVPTILHVIVLAMCLFT